VPARFAHDFNVSGMHDLVIVPGKLTLPQLRRCWRAPLSVALHDSAWPAIDAAVDVVARVIDEGRTVYGINTGFGLLAQTRIAAEDLEELQRRIVLSHAAGVGAPMPDHVVRLMLLLKVNSLARGHSGVRRVVINALLTLLQHDVLPVVPSKGSVGASGDLAPLAHLSCLLLGEGTAHHEGKEISAIDALKIAGLSPLVLAPKEGLALLNGTQASTAYALHGLFEAENLLCDAIVVGAMAVEAARGSRTPFDPRIHAARGHAGQIDVAAALRDMLGATSEIGHDHEHCEKVQDPYSLRCQPQVLGACFTQIRNAADVILIESNAVSDNPLIFADDNDILSGGNFHAEPVAFAADNLALAIAEIGALSERRIALLIDKSLSGLPPFLVDNGGVNSGFMIAQVTAAALASENKSLAHPASVDSLPTSANQEDHVSMATFAARRLSEMAENTRHVLAIEWLAATQGLDFRLPLRSSPAVEAARDALRARIPFYAHDRYFAPDIAAASTLLQSGTLFNTCRLATPSLPRY
jgi:histidine ammonia-lyase